MNVCKDEGKDEERVFPERVVSVCNSGNTAITVDDNCYVINNWVGGKWRKSAWIFPEALLRIKQLPDKPNDAVVI